LAQLAYGRDCQGMIKKYLRDLTLIDSVEAVAIYANDNSILDNWNRPNFQNNILKEISLHYLQLFYLLETDVNNFREIIISHDRGYIYARALPDLMLIIIYRIPVDISRFIELTCISEKI
jgi:hypothetical protein